MRGSPALRAIRRSKASSARTSPTSKRSGRIRSASITSLRSRTSPVPSSDGCRHCIGTQSGSGTLTSKTSSQVTTRSRAGIAAARQLSIVVFPAWVAPATMTFSPAATVASRNLAAWWVSVPSPTSSSRLPARTTNLRIFTAQCRRVMSGITTCSRLPSASIASTNGWLRSTRRPEDFNIRSTRSCSWPGSSTVVVSSLRPARATNTRPGSLIQLYGRLRHG